MDANTLLAKITAGISFWDIIPYITIGSLLLTIAAQQI
jgi:hypothetical protein